MVGKDAGSAVDPEWPPHNCAVTSANNTEFRWRRSHRLVRHGRNPPERPDVVIPLFPKKFPKQGKLRLYAGNSGE